MQTRHSVFLISTCVKSVQQKEKSMLGENSLQAVGHLPFVCLSFGHFLSLWRWFLISPRGCRFGALRGDRCSWEEVAPTPAHQQHRMCPVRQHLGAQHVYIYSQETLILQEGLVGNNFSPDGGHWVCKQCLHPVAASYTDIKKWAVRANGVSAIMDQEVLIANYWCSKDGTERRGISFFL